MWGAKGDLRIPKAQCLRRNSPTLSPRGVSRGSAGSERSPYRAAISAQQTTRKWLLNGTYAESWRRLQPVRAIRESVKFRIIFVSPRLYCNGGAGRFRELGRHRENPHSEMGNKRNCRWSAAHMAKGEAISWLAKFQEPLVSPLYSSPESDIGAPRGPRGAFRRGGRQRRIPDADLIHDTAAEWWRR